MANMPFFRVIYCTSAGSATASRGADGGLRSWVRRSSLGSHFRAFTFSRHPAGDTR